MAICYEFDPKHRSSEVTKIMHAQYKPFIILTMARTGSTFLSRMLGQHLQIVSCDELFGENPRYSRQEYLQMLFESAYQQKSRVEFNELLSSQSLDSVSDSDLLDTFLWHQEYLPHVRAVGLKLLYAHIYPQRKNDLTNYFQNRIANMNVILLVRRNWLRQFISLERAKQTGKWEQRIGQPNLNIDPVRVSSTQLQNAFLHFHQSYKTLESLAGTADSFYKMTYEDFTNQREKEWNRIQQFLGVSSEPLPQINLQKQNNEPLSRCLDDYEHLKEVFYDTSWRSFFDE